jgi:glycosyltransferase involved in cell wall biosynthesis
MIEGFGTSALEAAATGAPIVASHLVAFVVEFLLGKNVVQMTYDGGSGQTVHQGAGAIVVPTDYVRGFACALDRLPANDGMRMTMGEGAYLVTIPHFTWKRMSSSSLADIDVSHD